MKNSILKYTIVTVFFSIMVVVIMYGDMKG